MNKEQYNLLIQKADKILKQNTYTGKDYPWGNFRMISPDKKFFHGIWNWDSAFHSIGMLSVDTEIAKEQILGFIQYQLDTGMYPDCIFENGEIVTKCTKPPLMAYAVLRIMEKDFDLEFLKMVYPSLEKNAVFWFRERKTGGLFHYDANTDKNDKDYMMYVGYDTGWDNSPRWDNVPNKIWAIDLNCYVYLMCESMSKLASFLNLDATEWDKSALETRNKTEQNLFDEKTGAYCDYNFSDKNFVNVLTPASFMPLYIKIASPDRAKCMAEIAKKSFLPGMPTVAYDSPFYDDKNDDAYWRGPCWLNVAYFAAKGLKNYGYDNIADEIKETILKWVYNSGEYIYENYNATTGKGLRQKYFSWSSVFVKEFINNW